MFDIHHIVQRHIEISARCGIPVSFPWVDEVGTLNSMCVRKATRSSQKEKEEIDCGGREKEGTLAGARTKAPGQGT